MRCYSVLESINSEDDGNMRLLRLYRFYGDDWYRGELLRVNDGLVVSQARRYYVYGGFSDEMMVDDFYQEGCIGFLSAIDRYSLVGAVKNGNRMKFSSYAVIWVRKKIFEFIQNNGMTVRYSARVQRAFNKYKGIIDDNFNEYGGLSVPIDYIVDDSRSVRLGVSDLHSGVRFEGHEDVEIVDEEYDEGDAFSSLRGCPLLDDAELKFATAIINSKDKVTLNYKEKRMLSNICDKLVVWRVKQQ